MKLSDLIKNYREENNISQREFARRCGLSNSLISILEMDVNPQTGKPMDPDMRTYRRLAEGMGCTVQELFAKLKVDSLPDASDEDHDILEALHQDPSLRMLFDRARRVSRDDVEFMISYAERILKKRDEE